MKVRFLGASESQIAWGNNDNPNELLVVGETYIVRFRDVHSWHTKIELLGFKGKKFNGMSHFKVAIFKIIENDLFKPLFMIFKSKAQSF